MNDVRLIAGFPHCFRRYCPRGRSGLFHLSLRPSHMHLPSWALRLFERCAAYCAAACSRCLRARFAGFAPSPCILRPAAVRARERGC